MVMLTQRLGTPATPSQVNTAKIVSPYSCVSTIFEHKHTLTLSTCRLLVQVHSQACLTSLVSGGRVGGVVSTRRFPAAAWPPRHPSTLHCTAWVASNATSWTHAWTCCRNSSTGTTSYISGCVPLCALVLLLFFCFVLDRSIVLKDNIEVPTKTSICQPKIGSFTWQLVMHH